nr:MAG TPA: hypothetical protein [Caudoviricetes sp.]
MTVSLTVLVLRSVFCYLNINGLYLSLIIEWE